MTDAMSSTGGFAGVVTLFFLMLSRAVKVGSYEEALISQLFMTKKSKES